jgi:hypothetical protein
MTVTYDRELLIRVLVYHQRKDSQYCACGWGVLGASHAAHVTDVYETCAGDVPLRYVSAPDEVNEEGS